jgi:hypothetical protein
VSAFVFSLALFPKFFKRNESIKNVGSIDIPDSLSYFAKSTPLFTSSIKLIFFNYSDITPMGLNMNNKEFPPVTHNPKGVEPAELASKTRET